MTKQICPQNFAGYTLWQQALTTIFKLGILQIRKFRLQTQKDASVKV